MASLSPRAAASVAFVLLLRLGGLEGVGDLPVSLQRWLQVLHENQHRPWTCASKHEPCKWRVATIGQTL